MCGVHKSKYNKKEITNLLSASYNTAFKAVCSSLVFRLTVVER